MGWAVKEPACWQTSPLSLRMPNGSLQEDDKDMATLILKCMNITKHTSVSILTLPFPDYSSSSISSAPDDYLTQIENAYHRGHLERHPTCLKMPDQIIDWVIHKIRPRTSPLAMNNKFGTSLIYGELTIRGLNTILNRAPENCYGFIDIGSGYGNILFGTACKKAEWKVIGVEVRQDLVTTGNDFYKEAMQWCSRWGTRAPRYQNYCKDVSTVGWDTNLGLEGKRWLIWANSLKWENRKHKHLNYDYIKLIMK